MASLLLVLVTCSQTTPILALGAISQSYKTDSSNVTTGALLSLTSANAGMVELADSTNATNLVGVAADKPLISLGNRQGTVQTVISGTTEVLTSDVNGAVKVGDKISASPVSGIGMKAISSSQIVGTAQSDLSSVPTVQKTIIGQDGREITMNVGLLPVAINVMYYSAKAEAAGAQTTFIPIFLQNIANGIAGKEVAPMRVLLSLITLLLGFITAMVILYAAVRNGVISMGRNPLAAHTLQKGLFSVIITAMGVLALTLIVIYIILLG